jgi:predicted MPP superfamily phosphohydrolase
MSSAIWSRNILIRIRATVLLWVLISLVGLGLALAFYAVVIERNWYAIRRHRVPCLPPGARPLRILHISDLHLRSGQRRKQRFLRELARLEPDLVVGTGDYLGDEVSVDATVATMAAIKPRASALFVLGSNDYYSPVPKSPLRYFRMHRPVPTPGKANPWPDLVEGLKGSGWELINNRALAVDGMDVVGLDDAHIGLADLSVATPRDGDGFRLAVAHSPDGARELADLGYDLILCGHTHGGQVRVPGVGALVTNSTLPRSMARGLHRLGVTWLHVNAGLGTSMYAPYRFACRPEVCVLELVPR